MKTHWVIAVLILASCQKSEVVSVYTGNQAIYGLTQASQYAVSGTVTFKERKDGATTIQVQLKGTDGNSLLPVHMHRGDVSTNGASIAALLNSVDAKTGFSETTLSQLADDTKVSYRDILNMAAYINVHLSSSGPASSVILAAGNIGVNGTKSSSTFQVGNCKSN